MGAEALSLARAQRRVRELALLSDAQLAEAYRATLLDSENLNVSPYIVTALHREEGLWARLTAALAEELVA